MQLLSPSVDLIPSQFGVPTISQLASRWKRTDPRGEFATQTGGWLGDAAVTLAMSSAEQSSSGLSSQVALQAAENEAGSGSGAALTLHVHAFASLHISAMPVTLLWTVWVQTATASAGFPQARYSFVPVRGR